MEKYPSTTAFVRFQDCDPMAHLNNSKYIDYMINAREDHLKQFYDLDVYQWLHKEQKAWVVGKNEIVYRKPALLMEEVLIQSQVLEYSPKHIKVEIAMFNKAKTQLKAILWTVFVPFNIRTQKAEPHSEFLMNLLEGVYAPVEMSSIEERVGYLENSLAPTMV